MDDRYFTPTVGQTYRHTNGDSYLCIGAFMVETPTATLERTSDHWTLVAHGMRMTPEGKIHWNYSTEGHWPRT